MKGNLFLNLEAQKNSKNKPEFLNVNFLDTFCICSRKNEGKWCVCFNASYFKYFWYSLCRKLTKSLALHGFGEIFADHHVSVHFSEEWNLLVFLSHMQNPEKRPDL